MEVEYKINAPITADEFIAGHSRMGEASRFVKTNQTADGCINDAPGPAVDFG